MTQELQAIFEKCFSAEALSESYAHSKLSIKAQPGADKITGKAFGEKLEENAGAISKKVLSGNYRFIAYEYSLIPKGPGKIPRKIVRPTIRDKLTLTQLLLFIRIAFDGEIENSDLHTAIHDVISDVRSGQYGGYVKLDLSSFFASIDQERLLGRLHEKLDGPALRLIRGAIQNGSMPRGGSRKDALPNQSGVPEGLEISLILADFYLSDLRVKLAAAFPEIRYQRYVDDILCLCSDEKEAQRVLQFLTQTLEADYGLRINREKSTCGSAEESFGFLGYTFANGAIGVRASSMKKQEQRIEELFRYARSHPELPDELFTWRLNLLTCGIIAARRGTHGRQTHKCYGWLYYYAQITDTSILAHLDKVVDALLERAGKTRTEEMKTFRQSYGEIRRKYTDSTYLLNLERMTGKQKKLLVEKALGAKVQSWDISWIDEAFHTMLFEDIHRLNLDIRYEE